MDMKYKVNIIELPNKILREKSKPVSLPLSKEDELLAKTMIYHVEDSIKPNSKFRPAVGVAAVQYGILKQMFYIYIENENGEVLFKDLLVNPKVIAKSDSKIALHQGEGCLSVNENERNQDGYIERSSRIIVDAYSYLSKKQKRYDCHGYVSIVMQHELDHLEGKLFIDHRNKKNPWNKAKNLTLI